MTKRIMIVEDEKDIAKMLNYNLKKEGYHTILAYRGEDAVKLAEKELPDLMILDLMLLGSLVASPSIISLASIEV